MIKWRAGSRTGLRPASVLQKFITCLFRESAQPSSWRHGFLWILLCCSGIVERLTTSAPWPQSDTYWFYIDPESCFVLVTICYVAARAFATDFCNLACLKCLFIIIIIIIIIIISELDSVLKFGLNQRILLFTKPFASSYNRTTCERLREEKKFFDWGQISFL